DREPIVNLRLFRHRNFAAGTLAMLLAYAVFFAIGLLVPLWLQETLGYTPIWSGLATAPIGIAPVLLTFFVGIRHEVRPALARLVRIRGDGRDVFHPRRIQHGCRFLPCGDGA